ncbi:MAG: hypothetical protein EON56_01505 [Alphaproteobacteria bacterium]|nr:MAG: hypothetical protein EON56_01505 [Alphaproteobacteria bacterium]
MRIATIAIALFLAGAAGAQDRQAHHDDHQILFTSGGELLTWCEQEARAHFAGQGVSTYQWTGRHWESGNTLRAEGKIRADGSDIPVACFAAKGSLERYASIQIDPEK